MKIKIKQATKKGYIEVNVGGCFSYAYPDSELRRGRVIDGGKVTPTLDTSCDIAVVEEMKEVKQIGNIVDDTEIGFKNPQRGRIYSDGISPTLNTCSGGGLEPKVTTNDFRVRKLTPLECFRLQGFSDELFNRAASINSDSQLYKQAGNAVTVNVIYEIAKRL